MNVNVDVLDFEVQSAEFGLNVGYRVGNDEEMIRGSQLPSSCGVLE